MLKVDKSNRNESFTTCTVIVTIYNIFKMNIHLRAMYLPHPPINIMNSVIPKYSSPRCHWVSRSGPECSLSGRIGKIKIRGFCLLVKKAASPSHFILYCNVGGGGLPYTKLIQVLPSHELSSKEK